MSIKLTFPDGNIKSYDNHITGIEVAKNISSSLAKKAVAIEIDDKLYDLSYQIKKDATVNIISTEHDKGLEIMRHDCAHILAQAAKELYQDDIQVTIGPAIENGFFYDFAFNRAFSTKCLETIENKMREIIARNNKFERQVWTKVQAIEYFQSVNEDYKVKIIEKIDDNEEISVYKQGDFIDVCRGPHALSSGYLKHFKLTKVSAAYWLGDAKNESLQRIYGTCWATKNDLDQYLFMLEEASKRYHVKIGKELDLFHLQDEAKGMVFWHDKGWSLYRIIEDYMRKIQIQNGYKEVKTPMLVDKKLWEDSGHWEKFGDNMFILPLEHETLAVKPMNCPCHVQIFNQGIKSYKDLPIKMAEFGSCHRYEPSGALHGLMRVRGFTQDDAHIFCEPSNITAQTIEFCNMLKSVYKDFGFESIKIKFSDRPKVRAGTDEIWDKSEKALKDAAEASQLEFTMNQGEGAFYGPKLEFILTDALSREWQCGTLQVDFVLPERLKANYINSDGQKEHPVILHRAILGSFERFIGILLEHYAGKLPLWLCPIQVAILNVTNETDSYAKKVYDNILKNNIRAVLDISSEKIGYKIREHSLKKIPIIIIVGKKEQENNIVNMRILGHSNTQELTINKVVELINDYVKQKKLL